MKRVLLAVAALALIASGGFASLATVQGADHRDSPLATGMPTGDINDVYAFRSPADNNNLVVMISVNPLIAPSDNATRGVFDPSVTYQIHVDRNGDLGDEILASLRVSGSNFVIEGFGATITDPITPPGSAPIISTAGGAKFFAGLRDDPFFFDLAGFQAFVAKPGVPVAGLRQAGSGTPVDTFAGTNILAIVIEVPISALGVSPANGVIRAWVSTERNGVRVDRMAIPTINTALIPSNLKDAFNRGAPATDINNFLVPATSTINGLRAAVDAALPVPQNGGPLGNLGAAAVAGALIPDIVTIDFSKPVQFPNGRRLQDDVIDVALGVVLNRGGAAGISDAIGANDKAFGSSFPYAADPHGAAPGAAPSGGLGPPSTGDGGLVSTGTMWTASAALFVLALLFGGVGALSVMRNRSN